MARQHLHEHEERVHNLQNQQQYVNSSISEKQAHLEHQLKEDERAHKPSLGQRIKRKVRRIFHGKEVEVEEEFDAHNAPAEGTLMHEHYEKDTLIAGNSVPVVTTSQNVEFSHGTHI